MMTALTARGAVSAVHCALLPAGTSTRGCYVWHDCREVDWVRGPLPHPGF